MCMEEIAQREYDELKNYINELKKCLVGDSRGGFLINMSSQKGRIKFYNKKNDVLNKTPHQCLKQFKLAIYNSLKTEFINSNQSCESILESRIVNLELEK